MNKMAEGGYEFDNDYDKEEEETSVQNDEEFQKYINKEIEVTRDLSENDAKIRKKETTKKMIKQFYKKNMPVKQFLKKTMFSLKLNG